MKRNHVAITLLLCSIIILINACSKSSDGGGSTPDACAGVNIVVSATVANVSATGLSDGSIVATATGSTGLSFSINNGTFQASGTFNGLAAGNYTITAKNAAGCTGSKQFTVTAPAAPGPCDGTAGPLFTAVKALIQANCESCHNNTIANGGMNWTVNCNIVTNKARIKARAVDEGTMPPTGPLSQADKNKITNWINAGGRITD